MGLMEEALRLRLWVTDRKAAINRQSDTAQMTAFTRRNLWESRGMVAYW